MKGNASPYPVVILFLWFLAEIDKANNNQWLAHQLIRAAVTEHRSDAAIVGDTGGLAREHSLMMWLWRPILSTLKRPNHHNLDMQRVIPVGYSAGGHPSETPPIVYPADSPLAKDKPLTTLAGP